MLWIDELGKEEFMGESETFLYFRKLNTIFLSSLLILHFYKILLSNQFIQQYQHPFIFFYISSFLFTAYFGKKNISECLSIPTVTRILGLFCNYS